MGNKDTDANKEDGRLQKAVEEAEKTKQLTPIIKEELRLSILNRRWKENKGDIEIEEKKPVIKTELTPEEVKKKLRRRQQNKDAARRCRAKKKRMESTVITEFFTEQAKTKELQREITQLRSTLAELKRILDEHAFSCQLTQAQSPPFNQQANFTFPPLEERFCYTDSYVDDRAMNNATPLEDPFDDPTLRYSEAVMYPLGSDSINLSSVLKREPTGSTCTVTSQESEFDPNLPSDLLDLEIPETLVFQQPCSPDLFPGRQSISDFIDEDFVVHN